jgi:hypothetical protein
MSNEKDEELDKLFRKRLEDPVNEPAFRDADWDAMEQMLGKGKKRPAIIYWLPILGSVAALLLIFLGYLFLKPEVVKPTKQDQMAANHRAKPDTGSKPADQQKDNTGISGEPARKVADNNKKQMPTSAKYAGTPASVRHGQKGKSFFTLSSGKVRRTTTGQSPVDTANNTTAETANTIAKTTQPAIVNSQPVVANNTVPGKKDTEAVVNNKTDMSAADNSATAALQAKQKDSAANANTLASATTVPVKAKAVSLKKTGNRPQFAIGVLASSDLNGVNSSFQQSKVGSNFGATLSVTFGKKWTISTGAVYAIKPYLTSFDNYHTAYQFTTTPPESVYANCRMLDIPLNINYQVYSMQANRITLGTGLSSYFMLREDYKFNYSNLYAAGTGPGGFTVINKNHNILSVLNLDVTYTHQINSKFGVTVQPYLKVPLADVGASQVRLQTTGVALGLSWNINNASIKPK